MRIWIMTAAWMVCFALIMQGIKDTSALIWVRGLFILFGILWMPPVYARIHRYLRVVVICTGVFLITFWAVVEGILAI